jgi:DNA invertase Pin-like site-specific DNA recombinase
MKGTFSELELSILRQGSQEALRLKAARGDLHTSVAIGYVRSADDRLEIDPDKRVREALHLAFRKFAEFGSVRQVPRHTDRRVPKNSHARPSHSNSWGRHQVQ